LDTNKYSEAVWTTLHANAFLSKKFELLYISTPKVACTTLKWWIAKLEGYTQLINQDTSSQESTKELAIHDTLYRVAPEIAGLSPEQLIEALTDHNYFRFAFVRNPYKRLFSAWQSKVLFFEPIQVSPYLGEEFVSVKYSSVGDISDSFSSFVQFLYDNESPKFHDSHWETQSNILLPNEIPYNIIYHIEDTSLFHSDLLKHNSSLSDNPLALVTSNESIFEYSPDFISTKTEHMIREMYIADFENFGYSDSKPTTGRDYSKVPFKEVSNSIKNLRARNQRIGDLVLEKQLVKEECKGFIRKIDVLEHKIDLLNDEISGLTELKDLIDKKISVMTDQIDRDESIITNLENEKENLTYEHQNLIREVDRYRLSRSWRITQPLRKVLSCVREIAQWISEKVINHSRAI
jgi:hypothetical protein